MQAAHCLNTVRGKIRYRNYYDKTRWNFRRSVRLASYDKNMKGGQAVLTTGSIMLITVYDSNLASPHTVASPLNVTRSCVMENSNTVFCWSAAASKIIGSFAERHGDKFCQRKYFIHLQTHICVQFTVAVRCNMAQLGKTPLLYCFINYCIHLSIVFVLLDYIVLPLYSFSISLIIFSVRRFTPSPAVLQYSLFHISSCLYFSLQLFPEPALLLDILSSWLAPSFPYIFCFPLQRRSIRLRHRFNGSCFCRNTAVNWYRWLKLWRSLWRHCR